MFLKGKSEPQRSYKHGSYSQKSVYGKPNVDLDIVKLELQACCLFLHSIRESESEHFF